MINELYQLAEALERAGIRTQYRHRKYIPIPQTTCIRITCSNGKVIGLTAVNGDLRKILRKYGTNRGAYPCLNLAPLYKITDKRIIAAISELKRHPETLDSKKLSQIKTWCQSNNWNKKFQNKYRVSLDSTPAELSRMDLKYPPLERLIQATRVYADNPALLHKQIETVVWEMLERGENVSLALDILLYQGKTESEKTDDYGSLSVAFECNELIKEGTPAVSVQFVKELNERLNAADVSMGALDTTDAFGIPFHATDEPMPKVKLAAGFEVTLRTMFKEQHSQERYGRTENASYPISPTLRKRLAAALEWLSCEERRNVTWMNIGKNEVLFAYPYEFPKENISFVRMFRAQEHQGRRFEEEAKLFITELRHAKAPAVDSQSDHIRLLILQKIDRARTKVLYTRRTDAYELEKCREEWAVGCAENLPIFTCVQPKTPFPLDIADTLNSFWTQTGERVAGKSKFVPKYHGMEVLLESNLSVDVDLRLLSRQAMTLGAFLGRLSAANNFRHGIWENAKDILALLGLSLYRKKIRKEDYMENLPYLYGQLLKASDEIHALYCAVVRKGDVPPQLVGGALFQAAAEAPVRTLAVLSRRTMPYYTWAKSYRLRKEQESSRAGWLIRMCDDIMTALRNKWTAESRFTDEEKAQLFIGYLAAFPQNEIKTQGGQKNEQ